MTKLILIRHGELEKQPTRAGEIDPSADWPLSIAGAAKLRQVGEYLRDEGIVDQNHLEAIVGTQARLRHSAFELGEFSPSLRFYVEDYLNGRLRDPASTGTDPLLSQTTLSDESFEAYLRRGPERLLDRVRRRMQAGMDFLVLASRELIVGVDFRLHGNPREERRQIIRSFAHDGESVTSPFDIAPGEIVIFQNELERETSSEDSASRFRQKKVINLDRPDRTTEWEKFRVRTYSRDELWGPGSAGLWSSE